MNMDQIRRTLVEHRKTRGLTQRAVAEAAGMGQAQLASLEKGRIPNPGFSTMCRWARGVGIELGITVADLRPADLALKINYEDPNLFAEQLYQWHLDDPDKLFQVAIDMLHDVDQLHRYINTVRAVVADMAITPQQLTEFQESLAQMYSGKGGRVLYPHPEGDTDEQADDEALDADVAAGPTGPGPLFQEP